MTTEQHMLALLRHPLAVCVALAALMAMGAALGGCQTQDELRNPQSLVSPYPFQDGDVLWAVAPLRNETGVSAVDPLSVSDTLAMQLLEARGVTVVPMNRTIAAMRSLGMSEVSSPGEARRLAMEMNVDGVVVGAITSWQPYTPPRLGMTLALYGRPGPNRLTGRTDAVDPRRIQTSATDRTLVSPSQGDAPLSVVSRHLDGANHEVQISIRAYAEGRHDPDSALGWRGYLASMSLFTKFACHRLAGELLDQERLRIARERAGQQALVR